MLGLIALPLARMSSRSASVIAAPELGDFFGMIGKRIPGLLARREWNGQVIFALVLPIEHFGVDDLLNDGTVARVLIAEETSRDEFERIVIERGPSR
jgi:hypothetical protein